MTDLLQHASHDQIALGMCAGALLISGTVMYFSFHVGQITNRVRNHRLAEQGKLALQYAETAKPRRAVQSNEKAA